jgi:DNA-binding transcriptional LysR family regulator
VSYPSIRSLEMFNAVVETGSFKIAADRLNVSASAISKAMADLEARIGTRLIARTTRKIALTEAGGIYHTSVSSALATLAEGAETVNEFTAVPRGVLRLAMPITFGQIYVAPLLPTFLKRYAQVRVDVTATDSVIDVVGGGYDLAIQGGADLRDMDLIARKLLDTPTVVCAAPDYLSANGVPLLPRDLAMHACLSDAQSHLPSEWVFTIAGRDQRIRVDGPLRSSSLVVIHHGARSGLGIVRLPYHVIAADIASGRLVRLLEPYESPDQAVYLLYPKQQNLALKTRVFIEFLVAKIDTAIGGRV